jgi:hypothetical protein
MNPPKPGEIYRHKRTEDAYVIQDCVPIKIADQWMPDGTVLYRREGTNDTYVRLTADFTSAFERVDSASSEPVSTQQERIIEQARTQREIEGLRTAVAMLTEDKSRLIRRLEDYELERLRLMAAIKTYENAKEQKQ